MGLDLENFGLGLLVGWGSGYLVYRARNGIRSVVGGVNKSAATAQTSVTRSADSRYVNDLIDQAEHNHLGGAQIRLSDVLIEPRFIPAPRLPAPPDDDIIHDIFRVIPVAHDHPFLHAAYNIETLSIDELAQGSRHLALLGMPGSGKTTALFSIALHSLGKVKFSAPRDKIQEKLDSEEAALSEKDRGVRVKERILMEKRARERLANERGLNFNAEADETDKNVTGLFNRLMPVYVHFADLLAPTDEYGSEIDPAELVIRAVQYGVGRVTASTIPRNLYKRIQRGEVLLLVDGFDDLPALERTSAVHWLRAFLAQYSENFVIVAGATTGYGGLVGAGLTPVYMRPWSHLDIAHISEKWAKQWANMSGKRRRAQPPDAAAVERAIANTRALLPIEVIEKIWANYGESTETSGIEGWMRTTLSRLLPDEQSLAAMAAKLGTLAALQLDEGYITSARLQTLAISGLEGDTSPSPEPASTETESTEKTAKKEDTETSSAQGRLLAVLRRSGMLIRFRGDRYQFRNSRFAAYFASLTLKNAPASDVLQKAKQPAWMGAVAYLALHTPVDDVVAARLEAPTDMLYNSWFEMARWLAYAPGDAVWRGDILRDLGNLLIAPNHYPLIRERAAAALIDTRDKNALLIFRRAVRNANPHIRRLASLGMGALGDAEAIKDLRPLLNDHQPDVQLAAGMALGATGTVEAMEAMAFAFTEGAEPLRQAIAEAFAALPEEGYPLLYDAIRDQDMMLRRAAVFGLRRIPATWSLIEIYRAFLEDEQWYVRSAAQQAFQELQYGREVPLTTPYVSPEKLAWLVEWAAGRGENIPAGDGAQGMLLKALQEGEPPIRALAAQSLGQMGILSTTKSLYNALRDRQEEVRVAAHQGLAALQTQIGNGLPTPTVG